MEASTEKAVVKKAQLKSRYNLRFERKFIYLGVSPLEVINQIVLTSKFCFREIYARRSVNNIYFDDLNHTFYKMNVSGDGLREKYRLRWYSDRFEIIENPTIEVKRKFGLTGDKFSHKLPQLQLNLIETSPKVVPQEILKHIDDVEIKSKFERLQPSLLNSYERRYFLSDCGNYRITIDYNMAFYNPKAPNYMHSRKMLPDVVLELKYPLESDRESRELTQDFKVRLSKNSKYVRGCDLVYNQKS